jgi:hypothetical protein
MTIRSSASPDAPNAPQVSAMNASGTKRKCPNARVFPELGGRPAVPSACRPQPPLTQSVLVIAKAMVEKFITSIEF